MKQAIKEFLLSIYRDITESVMKSICLVFILAAVIAFCHSLPMGKIWLIVLGLICVGIIIYSPIIYIIPKWLDNRFHRKMDMQGNNGEKFD